MDLKKLFVWVPEAAHSSFVSAYLTDGQPNAACIAAFPNKVVFLEKTNQIIVKGKFFGTDLAGLETRFSDLYDLLGLTEGAAFSKTVEGTAYTDVVAWIEALAADYAAKDAAIISSYEAADSAVITSYQAADAAIISSYEAADAAIIAKLPAVAVSGSGLKLETSTDVAGKTTYTVVADQSIWEFLGSAEASSFAAADIATALDAKYAAGVGTTDPKRTEKEAGDVWAVSVTDKGTSLYAWDGANWVVIGSAAGVSGIDATPSHGVALQNVASVVSVVVTPGSVADGDASVITGGAAYTAIQKAEENAYAEAAAKAADAQANAYAYTRAEVDTAYNDLVSYASTHIDAAIEGAVQVVDVNSADAAYMSVARAEADGKSTYTISFDETALQNYVVENLWEEYSAS